MPLDFRGIRIGERYDRPTLARIWGYQSHEAISRGVVTPKDGSQIVLFVTRIKQAAFTQYKDYISGDLLFWEGEAGHGSDERIAKSRRGTVHLFFREIHHSPFEYKGEIKLRRHKLRFPEPSLFVFRLLHDQGPEDDLKEHSNEIEAAPVTEREALRKSRVGQGRFREDLFRYWQRRCAVTGLPMPGRLLSAAHIKPWRFSSNPERLDRFNGLLLLPQYHALLDEGWISFTDDRTLLLSRVVPEGDLARLGIQATDRLGKLDPRHRPYLEYHRKHVFLR